MVEIYALTDPGTKNIRYIGKANDAGKRLKSHLLDSRRRSTPVYCWIRKLSESGTMPGLIVLKRVSDEEWPQAERELIFFHRACGARLLNVADGGDQPACSREQRAANGRKNSHAIHSDPRRKRLWQLKHLLGRSLQQGNVSEATKQRMRERMDIFGQFAKYLIPEASIASR